MPIAASKTQPEECNIKTCHLSFFPHFVFPLEALQQDSPPSNIHQFTLIQKECSTC